MWSVASRCRRAPYMLLFFFFPRLLTEVHERISTKHGDIFTCNCYFSKLARTPPVINPYRLRTKAIFWDPNFKFDRKYLCNGTWYQQSERNLSIYRDSLHTPKWKWLASFLPTPRPHFRIGRLPALPHRRYITDKWLTWPDHVPFADGLPSIG